MAATVTVATRSAGHGRRPVGTGLGVPRVTPQRSLLILLAGPGPLHDAALRLFEAGHVPIVGTDLAAPLAATRARDDAVRGPGETGRAGDTRPTGITGTLVGRLLVMCDALVRVGGAADEADMLVRLATWEGKPVYYRVADVPVVG